MNAREASPRIDTAESWLARLDSPRCTAQDRRRFEQWLQVPAHAEAYARLERLHHAAAGLASDPLMRAAARAARQRAERSRRRRRGTVAIVATAAALLVAVGIAGWRRGAQAVEPVRYATAVARQQALKLDDGTRVLLDAESAITVRYGERRREVTLDRGRARFAVARDAHGRPFSVRAGHGVIRDIGTTFVVSLDPAGVTVGLLDGALTVGSGGPDDGGRALAPNQQVNVDVDGRVGPVLPLEADAEGWTRGELSFDRRRLDALLEDMNRYSQTKLHLSDPALAGLQISGNFHAGDQASLIQALERGWSLRAVATGPHEWTLYPTGARATKR